MKIIRNKAFLVCSILFLMIAVSGIGVFTYSYFTDRTENSELATAGTVDIELDTINEQIQNIAQKKDTLCRMMYN